MHLFGADYFPVRPLTSLWHNELFAKAHWHGICLLDAQA